MSEPVSPPLVGRPLVPRQSHIRASEAVNPQPHCLEIIEVQVGSDTGEDDIVRLEDVYNRL